jgi:FAD/FMN-containing dehydrogenase
VKNLTPPLAPAPAYLLIELAGKNAHEDLLQVVAALPNVVDTAVAEGTAGERLWFWRESHTEAINTLGPPLKLDVTLPIAALAGFIESVPALVRAIDLTGQPWFFGHVADGNVHVNVTGLSSTRDSVAQGILRRVVDLGGSISTEHGIGRTKRQWLPRARTADDLRAMGAIKGALDPASVMNPNMLLS